MRAKIGKLRGVPEYLQWARDFLGLSSSKRNEIKNLVLDQIVEYKKRGTQSEKEAGRQLKKWLNSAEFEFVGVVPNVSYIKTEGPKKDLDVLWVHPFGMPSLLFAHKKTCFLVIAGPLVRFNDSVVNELDENEGNVPTNGITG